MSPALGFSLSDFYVTRCRAYRYGNRCNWNKCSECVETKASIVLSIYGTSSAGMPTLGQDVHIRGRQWTRLDLICGEGAKKNTIQLRRG